MKRTEPEIIGTSFLKFYKTTDNINYIEAAKYLLYGILADHPAMGSAIYQIPLSRVVIIEIPFQQTRFFIHGQAGFSTNITLW